MVIFSLVGIMAGSNRRHSEDGLVIGRRLAQQMPGGVDLAGVVGDVEGGVFEEFGVGAGFRVVGDRFVRTWVSFLEAGHCFFVDADQL